MLSYICKAKFTLHAIFLSSKYFLRKKANKKVQLPTPRTTKLEKTGDDGGGRGKGCVMWLIMGREIEIWRKILSPSFLFTPQN